MATKWCIIGSGKICHDFVLCLRSLPKTKHEIVAVVDMCKENAKNFASQYGISNYYDSYEELLKETVFDVAYVGVINPCHFEVCKIFLQSGKNVLCEKPLVMHVEQAEELIRIAKREKKFLMEGIWSVFSPLYKTIKREIAQGTIGNPNLLQISFAINGMHVDRLTKRHLGGGCVLDLAIYAIHFATFIYEGEKPENISTTGYVNDDGVEEFVTIALQYSRERIANISISFRCAGYNGAIISGPKGIIRVLPPFHCPVVVETPTQKYKIKLPEVTGTVNYLHSEGLVYEAEGVRECLQHGLLECPLLTLEESKTTASIMTEVRNQLGVLY